MALRRPQLDEIETDPIKIRDAVVEEPPPSEVNVGDGNVVPNRGSSPEGSGDATETAVVGDEPDVDVGDANEAQQDDTAIVGDSPEADVGDANEAQQDDTAVFDDEPDVNVEADAGSPPDDGASDVGERTVSTDERTEEDPGRKDAGDIDPRSDLSEDIDEPTLGTDPTADRPLPSEIQQGPVDEFDDPEASLTGAADDALDGEDASSGLRSELGEADRIDPDELLSTDLDQVTADDVLGERGVSRPGDPLSEALAEETVDPTKGADVSDIDGDGTADAHDVDTPFNVVEKLNEVGEEDLEDVSDFDLASLEMESVEEYNELLEESSDVSDHLEENQKELQNETDPDRFDALLAERAELKAEEQDLASQLEGTVDTLSEVYREQDRREADNNSGDEPPPGDDTANLESGSGGKTQLDERATALEEGLTPAQFGLGEAIDEADVAGDADTSEPERGDSGDSADVADRSPDGEELDPHSEALLDNTLDQLGITKRPIGGDIDPADDRESQDPDDAIGELPDITDPPDEGGTQDVDVDTEIGTGQEDLIDPPPDAEDPAEPGIENDVPDDIGADDVTLDLEGTFGDDPDTLLDEAQDLLGQLEDVDAGFDLDGLV